MFTKTKYGQELDLPSVASGNLDIYFPCKKKDCTHFAKWAVCKTETCQGFLNKTKHKIQVLFAEHPRSADCCQCKHFEGVDLYQKK